jgi:rfaE bifunctional protein kinase chain/domain
MTARDYRKVLRSFRRQRILVIGDVMVDAYIFGKVERISPEAPVPVVHVERRVSRLGGAANVALNIKSLGATPVLCSVVGEDARGEELTSLLAAGKMLRKGVIRSHERITTTKFRVIGNNSQLLRVDEEDAGELSKKDELRLLRKIYDILATEKIDAIVIQDYDKGVLTAGLIGHVTERANTLKVPVIVDPKKRNFLAYRDVALFKPNLKELREGLRVEIDPTDLHDLERAASILHHQQNITTVMTTLSEHGIFISTMASPNYHERQMIPAHVRQIADVSGAGDTVVSVAALCLAAHLSSKEIAAIANLAGGMVCEEVGVVPVNARRLEKELASLRIP